MTKAFNFKLIYKFSIEQFDLKLAKNELLKQFVSLIK